MASGPEDLAGGGSGLSTSVSELLASTTTTPIAQLGPHLATGSQQATRAVRGEVTVVWPFNSVKRSLAFLLAEPDVRLRRQKGQIRVQLNGACAAAVAKTGLGGGDELFLGLDGATWGKDESSLKLPGSRVEWQLEYHGRLILQAKLDDGQETRDIFVDGQQEELGDDLESAATPAMLVDDHAGHGSFSRGSTQPSTPQIPDQLQHARPHLPFLNNEEYASPAFLKRARISFGSLYEPGYDIFEDDGGVRGRGRKRTRFGRPSNTWRYSSLSASPEREPEERAHADEDEPGDKDMALPLAQGTPKTSALEAPSSPPVLDTATPTPAPRPQLAGGPAPSPETTSLQPTTQAQEELPELPVPAIHQEPSAPQANPFALSRAAPPRQESQTAPTSALFGAPRFPTTSNPFATASISSDPMGFVADETLFNDHVRFTFGGHTGGFPQQQQHSSDVGMAGAPVLLADQHFPDTQYQYPEPPSQLASHNTPFGVVDAPRHDLPGGFKATEAPPASSAAQAPSVTNASQDHVMLWSIGAPVLDTQHADAAVAAQTYTQPPTGNPNVASAIAASEGVFEDQPSGVPREVDDYGYDDRRYQNEAEEQMVGMEDGPPSDLEADEPESDEPEEAEPTDHLLEPDADIDEDAEGDEDDYQQGVDDVVDVESDVERDESEDVGEQIDQPGDDYDMRNYANIDDDVEGDDIPLQAEAAILDDEDEEGGEDALEIGSDEDAEAEHDDHYPASQYGHPTSQGYNNDGYMEEDEEVEDYDEDELEEEDLEDEDDDDDEDENAYYQSQQSFQQPHIYQRSPPKPAEPVVIDLLSDSDDDEPPAPKQLAAVSSVPDMATEEVTEAGEGREEEEEGDYDDELQPGMQEENAAEDEYSVEGEEEIYEDEVEDVDLVTTEVLAAESGGESEEELTAERPRGMEAAAEERRDEPEQQQTSHDDENGLEKELEAELEAELKADEAPSSTSAPAEHVQDEGGQAEEAVAEALEQAAEKPPSEKAPEAAHVHVEPGIPAAQEPETDGHGDTTQLPATDSSLRGEEQPEHQPPAPETGPLPLDQHTGEVDAALVEPASLKTQHSRPSVTPERDAVDESAKRASAAVSETPFSPPTTQHATDAETAEGQPWPISQENDPIVELIETSAASNSASDSAALLTPAQTQEDMPAVHQAVSHVYDLEAFSENDMDSQIQSQIMSEMVMSFDFEQRPDIEMQSVSSGGDDVAGDPSRLQTNAEELDVDMEDRAGRSATGDDDRMMDEVAAAPMGNPAPADDGDAMEVDAGVDVDMESVASEHPAIAIEVALHDDFPTAEEHDKQRQQTPVRPTAEASGAPVDEEQQEESQASPSTSTDTRHKMSLRSTNSRPLAKSASPQPSPETTDASTTDGSGSVTKTVAEAPGPPGSPESSNASILLARAPTTRRSKRARALSKASATKEPDEGDADTLAARTTGGEPEPSAATAPASIAKTRSSKSLVAAIGTPAEEPGIADQAKDSPESGGDVSILLARAPSSKKRATPATLAPPTATTTRPQLSMAEVKLALDRSRDLMPDCIPLRNLRPNLRTVLDVAVVATTSSVDGPPRRTRARQYAMSFTATDPSLVEHVSASRHHLSLHAKAGGSPTTGAAAGSDKTLPSAIEVDAVVEVKLFRAHKDSLPSFRAGDGLLLRRFEVIAIHDKGFGLQSTDESAYAVFPRRAAVEGGAPDEDAEAASGEQASQTAATGDGSEAAAGTGPALSPSPEPRINGPPVEDMDREGQYISLLKQWYQLLDEGARVQLAAANARFAAVDEAQREARKEDGDQKRQKQ